MSAIDKSNFRDVAQTAIKKYTSKGMLIDAMIWSTIIGYYEAAIASNLTPPQASTTVEKEKP